MTLELKKWTNKACKDIVGVCDNEFVVISGTRRHPTRVYIYLYGENTRDLFTASLITSTFELPPPPHPSSPS